MSTITGIVGVIFIFGIIIAIHEIGHFIFARISKMKVEEFALGMGPKIFSITRGETAYSLRWIPFGGFVNIAGMEVDDADLDVEGGFNTKPWIFRFLTLVGGVLFNALLALFFIFIISFAIGFPRPVGKVIVAEVFEDTPAADAGILAEDVILGVNGINAKSPGDISDAIRGSNGEELTINILRDGEKSDILVTPKSSMEYQDHGGWGAIEKEKIYTIGVGMRSEGVKYETLPFVDSVKNSWFGVGNIFRMSIISIVSLFEKTVPATELSGPVGIIKISYDASSSNAITRDWWTSVLMMAAFLSFSVGFFNLLPLPALDGGRILFLFIELFRGGKAVNRKTEAIIHGIGLAVLLLFMAIITFKDVWVYILPLGGK